MSLLGIVRYLNGYLDISVKGDCAEQLINICTRNNVTVWRVRKELGTLKFRISVKDYKHIRKLRKQLKLRLEIKILKKHGIRFKIYRYRKRKGLLVGLILFFALLIFMNNFIWTIEIKGNKTIASEKIISACKELGVYEGVYKKRVDTYNLPLKLILNLDGIAWCSFNIEGSSLSVEISEAKASEKDETTAANLIAKRDGVIEKLEISDGTKMVKIGQAVRKGDILASGVIDNGVRTYTVKANGKVRAKTNRTFKFNINKEFENFSLTGKRESRSVINFFGIKIPLYLGNIKYPYKDKVYENNATMFGQKLPIGINTKTFEEIKTNRENIDEKTARNMALELLCLEAKKLGIYSLKIESFSVKLEKNEYICSIDTQCTEDISEIREINTYN